MKRKGRASLRTSGSSRSVASPAMPLIQAALGTTLLGVGGVGGYFITRIETNSANLGINVEEENRSKFKRDFADIFLEKENKRLEALKKSVIFETEDLKEVKFICDPKSEKPTMVARTLKGDIPVVTWEYEGFSNDGYNPLTRCNNVADRFEKARQSGSLEYNYVTTGTLNGWNVVCLVKNKGDSCTEQGLLFTLHDEKDSKSILLELVKARLEIKYGCLSRSASGNCSGLLFVAIKQ